MDNAKHIPVIHIERDVPIPPEQEAPLSDSFPLDQLEVGDSFEFPAEHRRYVQSRASTLKKRKGKEFTVRKVDELSARVWRMK